jgi:hypothetical protein
MKPMLKASGTKRLKPKHDNMISIFAFNFKLRRYIQVKLKKRGSDKKYVARVLAIGVECDLVGRCRLTVSKPELEARLVSALETRM